MRRISVLCVLLLIFVSGSAAKSATTSRVTFEIVDAGGAQIPEALVRLHWDPSGSGVGLKVNVGIKEDLLLTFHDGSFSGDVPPGFYDVFVSAMAFTPESAKIRVVTGKSFSKKIRLNADPQVTKELGDSIY